MATDPDVAPPPLHDRSLIGLGLTIVLTLVVGLVCALLRLPAEVSGPAAGLAGAVPGVVGYQVWASKRKRAGQSTKSARPIGYLLAIALGGLLLIDTVLGALLGSIAGMVDAATFSVLSTIVIVLMLAIVLIASLRLARSLGRFAVAWTIGIIVVAFIVRCIILFGFLAAYVTSVVGPGWEAGALDGLIFSWSLLLIAGAVGSLIGWYRAKKKGTLDTTAAATPGAPAMASGPPAPPNPLDRRVD